MEPDTIGPVSSGPGLYQQIGQALRNARKNSGLSQLEVADAVGLTRTSISNIETGRQRFLLHTLLDLAAVLAVNPADLLPHRTKVENKELEGQLPVGLPSEERAFIQEGIRQKGK